MIKGDSWEIISSKIKESAKYISDLRKSDEELFFYYDESNNIRKYILKSTGFNNDNVNFSLAGVFSTEEKDISKEELYDLLGFTNNANFKEFKFKHFIKKNSHTFFEMIDTDKFTNLFKFIKDKNLYIHVSILNVFYYGIVDIVDEIIHDTITPMKLNKVYVGELKEFVYSKMFLEYNRFSEMFYDFHYPNIKEADSIQFLENIKEYFETVSIGVSKRELNKEWLGCIKKKMDCMKSSTDKLVLLAHNQDDILIENFSELYSHKIFVYDKSIHLFDEETVIEEHWCQTGMSKSTIKDRYNFDISEKNIMLHISDVIAGIFAKLFDYMACKSIYNLKSTVTEMDKNSRQYKNLKLLMELINRTELFESYLLNFTVPTSLHKKFIELYNCFY